MQAVVGLLVMLLGVSHGVVTHCDGRQDRAQCYGALGGTVVLQLMNNASEIHKYQLLNKTTIILSGRRNAIITNLTADRFFFTPNNGTFRIYQLSRFDDGEYIPKTYNLEGRESVRTLQLTIQAPVSSVRLVPECLSQGEMKVSCSSEGADSPQYSWTLDGKALTDSELLSGNTETNDITLRQHVSGRLVCSVRNKVSSDLEEVNISTCEEQTTRQYTDPTCVCYATTSSFLKTDGNGFIYINCTSPNGTHISEWVFAANNTLQCIEPTSASTTITATSPAGKESGITVSINPYTNSTSSNNTVTHPPSDDSWDIMRNYLQITAYVLAALVLLLVVGVAVVCAQKKKKNNKPQETGDQELIYADVRIAQRPGRQLQQRAEMEVEYGQVMFSERPRHTAEPAEECMYAKVRKGR